MLDVPSANAFSDFVLEKSPEEFEKYLGTIDNTQKQDGIRPLDKLLGKFLTLLREKQPQLMSYTPVLQKINALLNHGARLNMLHEDQRSTRNFKELYEMMGLKDKGLTYAVMGMLYQRGYDLNRNMSDASFTHYFNTNKLWIENRGILCLFETVFPTDQSNMGKNRINSNLPGAVDAGGNTYLHEAVVLGKSLEEIKSLIKDKGFSVTKTNDDGINPLEVAKYFTPQNTEVIQFLSEEYIRATKFLRPLEWAVSFIRPNLVVKTSIEIPVIDWRISAKDQYDIELESENLTFEYLVKKTQAREADIIQKMEKILKDSQHSEFNSDGSLKALIAENRCEQLHLFNNELEGLHTLIRTIENSSSSSDRKHAEKLLDKKEELLAKKIAIT